MKKLYLCYTWMLAVVLTATSAFAQNYDLQFRIDRDDNVAAGFYDVTVRMAASGSNFKVGTSNLVFDFNTSALTAPGAIAAGDSLEIQTIHNFSGTKYQKLKLTSPASGRLSLNIELNTPTDGDTLFQVYTDLATIRFTIVNPATAKNLAWRTTSPNAIVVFDDTESSVKNIDELNDPATLANIKVFLEGPFNSANDSMFTTINENSYLPLKHPYGGAPWNYAGNDSVKVIPNADIVDWVLVQLRSSTTAIVETRAAFLKADGAIVDLDGTNPVTFDSTSGSYYVVIYHRNHLEIMTASAISLNETTTLADRYDFSSDSTQSYTTGNSAVVDMGGTGVFGMFSGETNGSSLITNADKVPVANELNNAGYYNSDANMSALVTNSDKIPVANNLNEFTKVPTGTPPAAPTGNGGSSTIKAHENNNASGSGDKGISGSKKQKSPQIIQNNQSNGNSGN